jgi:hypothetical protein
MALPGTTRMRIEPGAEDEAMIEQSENAELHAVSRSC